MNIKNFSKLFFLSLAIIQLVACGSGAGDEPETQAAYEYPIATSGGVVEWAATDDSGVKAQLTIADGALDSDTTITVKAATGTDDGIRFVSGTILDFGPDGLVFNTPAKLVIEYDPAQLADTPENALTVYKQSDGVWKPLATTVDTELHTVTVELTGFSSIGIGIEIIPPKTTASPQSDSLNSGQTVTLNCTDLGSGCDKTFYTIDGSEPDTSSSEYSTPIVIDNPTTLKFFSVDQAGNQEQTRTEEYTIASTVPTYNLGGTVSGLNGVIVLQYNSGNNQTISQNGPFTFNNPIQDGTQYLVSIVQKPNGQACDLGNEQGTIAGANVLSVSVTCVDAPLPFTPSGVVATPADEQVSVSWVSVDGADSYRIYWNTSGNVTTGDTVIMNIIDTSYIHSSLANDTTYYYIVTALNENGESLPSSQVSATPVSPGDIPDWQWTVQPGTTGGERANDIAVDAAGNVYMVGYTTEGIDGQEHLGGYDIFVTKYNTYGIRQWTVQNGTTENDYGWGVDVDTDGNVYITGHTYGDLDGHSNSGIHDTFVSKYNADGVFQWTVQSGTQYEDRGYDIAVDGNGNTYITGFVEGAYNGNSSFGGRDIFVSKYDTNGNHLWTKQRGTNTFDTAYGIVLDSSNNVYITGYTGKGLDGNEHQGSNDIIIAKFDTDGTHQWTTQSGTIEGEHGHSIALDASNNIFISGSTRGDIAGTGYNGGSHDAYIAKYNSSGMHQWTNAIGSSGADWGYGVNVDSTGNVYATGTTEGSLDGNTNLGVFDIYLIKYDTDGLRLWTLQPGTSVYDEGTRVVLDTANNIYLTGHTYGGLDGNEPQGNTDAFISKYGTSGGMYTVGGNASGVIGEFVLQNNNGDDLIINDNGDFVFDTPLPDGANYSVTIKTQPPGGLCFVSGGHNNDGSGQISGANVTNIVIECVGV